MQPYQTASEEIKRQKEVPGKLLKKAVNFGLGLAGGSLAFKALPFLSPYIPTQLVQKGLSKIDPRLGKFLNGAQQIGLSEEEAKEFLKEKLMTPKEEKKEALSKFKEHQKKKGMVDELKDQFNEYYSPEAVENRLRQSQESIQPQQSQQVGQGQRALMEILERINQRLGGQ